MVDYTKATGSAGALIIRDDGTNVSFLIRCNESSTNIGFPGKGWSGRANGARSGSFTWPSGGGTRVIGGPWVVTTSQTVSFSIADTDTQGLGGPTSLSVSITRPLPPAPGTPSVARVSDTQHTLSWSRPAAYSSQVIQRRVDSGAWQQIAAVSGTATTFTDTTTSANHKYEHRVAGRTASGQSAWSGISTFYTTPAAPSGITAARVGDDILVSASAVPPYATSFDVKDGTTVVATSVSMPWTHAAPSAAVPHTYTVRAKVGALASAYSAPSNTVQLISPPNAPTGLNPNGAVRAGDADVRFTWVHNPVDSSLQTAYELRYRPEGTTDWVTLSGTTATYRDIALAVGTWEWQARTKGAHPDFSPWSATATGTVINRPGVAITQPVDDWEASTLTVEWSWFQAQSRPQSAWQLELLDESLAVVESRSGSGATAAVTLARRLTAGDWTVRVRGATGEVWSDWSSEAFTVAFDPPAPPLLVGEWDDAQGGVSLAIGAGIPGDAVFEDGVWFVDFER